MQVQKGQNNIKSSPSIDSLINSNTVLLQYFRSHSHQKDYAQLAVQLIAQAIHSRKNLSIGRHYNVAYIKHNRFLSPSQKQQQVTPKVTEIIPVSPEKVVIFGKPKVKLIDGQFCVQHGRNEPQIPQKDSNFNSNNREQQNIPKRQKHLQNDEYMNDAIRRQTKKQKRQDSEVYLSPKDSRNKQKHIKTELNKQVNNSSSNKKQNQKANKYQADREEPKQKANFKAVGSNQQGTGSPQYKKQSNFGRYDNIQSKHKFQIERDKRNKKLQKQLQWQKKKLERLEQRQQRLLLKQYQQQKQIQRQSMFYIKDQMSCSCSSDGEFDHKYVELRERLDDRDVNLNMRINKIQDKTYKISSQPIYPLTSSSSSEVELEIQNQSSDY